MITHHGGDKILTVAYHVLISTRTCIGENCSEHYGHEGPRELELCFAQLRHASNGIIARPDSAGELPPMPADCRRFDNAIMDQMSTINDNRHWQIHVESLTGGINRQECH
jgi:hypothetical protein